MAGEGAGACAAGENAAEEGLLEHFVLTGRFWIVQRHVFDDAWHAALVVGLLRQDRCGNMLGRQACGDEVEL